VLTPLPQADGEAKQRPAILLRQVPPFGDWLVCGVSTQVHHEIVGFDDLIEPSHADFAGSGLKAPSLIRLGFLVGLTHLPCPPSQPIPAHGVPVRSPAASVGARTFLTFLHIPDARSAWPRQP